MGCGSVDDPAVTEATCTVIARVQEAGLSAHVGGCVTPVTLAPILARVKPDGFHTRFLAFDRADDGTVTAALHTEISLLELLAACDAGRAATHTARIETTRRRMETSP